MNLTHKLINALRIFKLGKRLVLTLVFIFISSAVIVGLILYNTSERIVSLKTDQYLSDYMMQSEDKIDTFLESQIKALDELATNLDLIDVVRDFDVPYENESITGLATVRNQLFIASRDIHGLIGLEVSTLNDMIAYQKYRVTTGNFNTSDIMRSTLESEDRIKFFGTISLENPNAYRYTSENGKGLVIGMKIKSYTNGDVVGMTIAAFSESSLYNQIYKGPYSVNDYVYIADKDGIVISSSDKSTLGNVDVSSITANINQLDQNSSTDEQPNHFNVNIEDTNYLVYYTVSDVTGWYIISLTNYDNLIAEINKNFVGSLILFVVFTILVFLLAMIITRSITIPINSVIQTMNKTSIENSYPEVAVSGNDEITYLCKTFNKMTRRNKALIQEIQVINKKEKQAQFKALQSQINPHFLYNTLDSVNWLAYLSGNNEICEIVNSLSKFFRLSLNKGSDFYLISDEIEHVKSYITIQNVKYKDKIEFVFNIRKKCLKYKTIKILLQPLVENAIYHGIEPKGGTGVIKIEIKQHDDIINMSVIDNGIGMDTQLFEVLKESSENEDINKGYGLANIDERIKLFFGESYGLHIESSKSGTKVTASIPLIKNERN